MEFDYERSLKKLLSEKEMVPETELVPAKAV